MRTTILVAMLAIRGACTAGDTTLQDAPQIEWAGNLDAALAQSAKDGRPVITYWTYDG